MVKTLCILGFVAGLVGSIITYTADYFGFSLNPSTLFQSSEQVEGN